MRLIKKILADRRGAIVTTEVLLVTAFATATAAMLVGKIVPALSSMHDVAKNNITSISGSGL